MKKLNVKSESQGYTWYYWHRYRESYHFDQSIGKQYTYGHRPRDIQDTSDKD